MKRTKSTFRTWIMKDKKAVLETVTGWRLSDDATTVLVYRTSTEPGAYHVISPRHGLCVGIGSNLKESVEIAHRCKDYINGVIPVKVPDFWYDPKNE